MSDRKSSMTTLAGTGCGILFLLPFAAVGIGAACLMVWHISSCRAAAKSDFACASGFDARVRYFAGVALLPRTALLNDEAGEQTAEWKIKVTGSEGPRDFEANYELAAFKRPRSQQTTPSLVE